MLNLVTNSDSDQPDPEVSPDRGPAITLRRFVITAVGVAATGWMWHHTHGDPILTTATLPLTLASLSFWIKS